MAGTTGTHKDRKRTRRSKCDGCHDLVFPRDKLGVPITIITQDGPASHIASIKAIVKSMGRGCQICFAILKAIDTLLLPYLTKPPNSGPVPIPAKADKFRFLAYTPGVFASLNGVSIRERNAQPVQIHVNIRMLLIAITASEFAIGKAWPLGDVTAVKFNFELFSDHLAPVPFDGIVPGRRVPARLTSKRRQRLVSEWLDECAKNHPHCAKPLPGDGWSQQWRPRRLIDLGGNPWNAVRLVDAADTTGHYMTLSHAPESPDRTTYLMLCQDNLARFKKRINWRDLDPIFQDAVVVASEQKIRYLWIQELCVIHGDAADWHWHVEQAHRIFGYSHLNIALTRSGQPRETCLGTRWLVKDKGIEVQDIEIQVFKDNKPYKIFARLELHLPYKYFHDKHQTARFKYHQCTDEPFPDYYPLLGDTKFVQEQIVAPRTIHIDETEFAWECRTTTACECRASSSEINRQKTCPVPMFKRALVGKPIGNSPDDLAGLWDAFRTIYAQKDQHSVGGRLCRLSGLASCLQPLMKKRYVAGLWANTREQLARELLWYIRSVSDASTVSQFIRRGHCGVEKPSWSWVSMRILHSYYVASAETMFDDDDDFVCDPDFHVRSIANVAPSGVADGENSLHGLSWQLHVSGTLITGKLGTRRHGFRGHGMRSYKFIAANAEYFPPPLPPATRDQPPPPPPAVRPAPQLIEIPPRTLDDPLFPAGDVMLDCSSFDSERRDSGAAVLSSSMRDDGSFSTSPAFTWAYFLLLGRIQRSGEAQSDARRAPKIEVGLALRRAGDGRTGAFERIGVFWLVSGKEGLFDQGQVQDIVLV
jgi:hypothetical protein